MKKAPITTLAGEHGPRTMMLPLAGAGRIRLVWREPRS